MRVLKKIPRTTTKLLCNIFFFFASLSLFISLRFFSSSSSTSITHRFSANHRTTISATTESQPVKIRHVSSVEERHPLRLQPSDSVLFPDWEVLLLLRHSAHSGGGAFCCLFQNSSTSPAEFIGDLPSNGGYSAYKCVIPNSLRRHRRLNRPVLMESPVIWPEKESDSPEMLVFRWDFLAYESISTETDVILFVKGVNHRQGVNRSPAELTCLFFSTDNGVVKSSVRTPVTSSSQEVFRCLHPNGTSLLRLNPNGVSRIKVSLQIITERGEEEEHNKNQTSTIVPSVAYYAPLEERKLELEKEKALICACTMVYNVAKFLKEWVLYHSKIGVAKFILYDNGSDDDLKTVVKELRGENFDIEVVIWPWPKAQEAGFTHCAWKAKDSCTWMMFIDVDEFVLSPSWLKDPNPSANMLRSFLPVTLPNSSLSVGQVLIGCLEFGPSNQKWHPDRGVTQGYTCRRRTEKRHKSIVLLDAMDVSLSNVVHHFRLKEGYRTKKLDLKEGVINHYKYQAWPEFKVKFRRRVSTYVVDWTRKTNLMSKDRTPGLGFEAVEPNGWANSFCEVHDGRLKKVTRKWFGLASANNVYRMAWQ